MCVQGQAAAPLSPASLANIPTDSLSSGVMPQNTSFHSGVTHHHLTFQLLATYQITFFVMHSGCWVHEFLLNIDSSGPILNISVLCQRVKMSYLKLRKIHTPNMGTYVAVHCLWLPPFFKAFCNSPYKEHYVQILHVLCCTEKQRETAACLVADAQDDGRESPCCPVLIHHHHGTLSPQYMWPCSPLQGGGQKQQVGRLLALPAHLSHLSASR